MAPTHSPTHSPCSSEFVTDPQPSNLPPPYPPPGSVGRGKITVPFPQEETGRGEGSGVQVKERPLHPTLSFSHITLTRGPSPSRDPHP